MSQAPASSPYSPQLKPAELAAITQLAVKQPVFQALLSRVRTATATWCNGIVRPVRSLLAAVTLQELSSASPILWVTPSMDNAERLCQDLTPFLPAHSRALLFPEKESARMLGEETTSSEPQRLAILQELDNLANGKISDKLVVVSSIRALLQPTVRVERLQKGMIVVHKGEVLDSGFMLELLINEGYRRVPMVERRGEVSVRGDIFDIFPITGTPVRLELFGDEIESMRSFHIDTQRSEGELNEVTLLPADEGEDEGAWLTDYLTRASHGNPLVFLEEETQLKLTAQEWYQEWATPTPEENPDIWDRVTDIFAKFRKTYVTGWASAKSILLNAGGDACCADASTIDEETGAEAGNPLIFPFEFTPGFGGRVDEMIAALPKWQAEGKRIVILSRQYLRLRELLAEKEIGKVVARAQDLPWQGMEPGCVLLLQGYVSEGFRATLRDSDFELVTDHELTGQRRQRRSGQKVETGTKLRLEELTIGDYVVHLQHGIGRYVGVETIGVQDVKRDMLHIQYARGASIYVPVDQLDLVQKYQGVDDTPPTLARMGGQDWARTKAKIRENVQQVAAQLLKIYAERQQMPGYAYPADTAWQHEMEDAFPYTETPDQLRAIQDVKKDLESAHPMDRLVCGDVGYGKTEVALRAAFKVLAEGRQVAVLVPTTVLAQQHFQTFTERLASYPIKIGLLSRFRSEKEQNRVVTGLSNGEVDIAIGTHRLLSRDVEFSKLGLLIIDEEHKFGVMHKERIREIRTGVDVLAMSATPIPRTLQMSLYGIREMSLIETPPDERMPIKTYLFEHHPDIIKAAITRELSREGQVFFVHNRVQGIERVAADIRRLVPQARVTVGHGQMAEGKLEKVMVDFYDGNYDVLVCTTIIESGLDMPNVNTVIINNADHFGLAQLYQLRGRVGRSIKQGYCYLLYPPNKKLTDEAEKRLETIRDFTHLGAGYQVARRDLEIRGAGDILGEDQSGHVAAVGFELYCEMLNEEISRLQGEVPVSATERSVVLEIPVPASLPVDYVSDARQKVALYRRIAQVKTRADLEAIGEELRDRYGVLPDDSRNLLRLVAIKLTCIDLLVPSIRVKEEKMTVLVPFFPPFTAKQRYKLSTLTGWTVNTPTMALEFAGLYGKAAGNKQYPRADVFLRTIDIILEQLTYWRDNPPAPEPEPQRKPASARGIRRLPPYKHLGRS